MRDTRRNLWIGAACLVVGSAITAFGAWDLEREGETALSGISIFVGLAIAPMAFFYLVHVTIAGIRKARLESGAGEIARWKLSAAEWSAFHDQEARFLAAGRPATTFEFRAGAPRETEIVFANRAVIIDGDYTDLTPGGFVDLQGVEFVPGAPACLEFHMTAQKSRGASGTQFGVDHLWLRVPIAAADTREAMRVMQHYKATTRRGPAIAMINPRVTLIVCAVILVASLAAAAWGFSVRSGTEAEVTPHLIAAVAGALIAIGAVILAGIVVYRLRVLKS